MSEIAWVDPEGLQPARPRRPILNIDEKYNKICVLLMLGRVQPLWAHFVMLPGEEKGQTRPCTKPPKNTDPNAYCSHCEAEIKQVMKAYAPIVRRTKNEKNVALWTDEMIWGIPGLCLSDAMAYDRGDVVIAEWADKKRDKPFTINPASDAVLKSLPAIIPPWFSVKEAMDQVWGRHKKQIAPLDETPDERIKRLAQQQQATKPPAPGLFDNPPEGNPQ